MKKIMKNLEEKKEIKKVKVFFKMKLYQKREIKEIKE